MSLPLRPDTFGGRQHVIARTTRDETQKPNLPGFWIYVGDFIAVDDPGNDPPDASISTPPFQNGWTYVNGTYDYVAFRHGLDGDTEFKGFLDIANAAFGTVAFTLPSEWRPKDQHKALMDDLRTTYVINSDTGTAMRAKYAIDASTGDVYVLADSTGFYEMKCFADANTFGDEAELVVVGDGRFIWEIPPDCAGFKLTFARAFITTVGSGTTTIQIRNITQAVDMLSTAITIDSGELSSLTAATPPVISGANSDVAEGDQISVDVDAAGTGAKGLGVMCRFESVA